MPKVLGIDLSGPSNTADTCLACFDVGPRHLRLRATLSGAHDAAILDCVAALPPGANVVVGLDAPLSYNPGGGDRPADTRLRTAITAKGMHPGSVMVPTMPRMAYLTLRGIVLARALEALRPVGLRVVEIHPGACLALRGAPVAQLRRMKTDKQARHRLLGWLGAQGLRGLPASAPSADHFVAACAAALAAWQWSLGRSVWLEPAAPPHHPYDFAC